MPTSDMVGAVVGYVVHGFRRDEGYSVRLEVTFMVKMDNVKEEAGRLIYLGKSRVNRNALDRTGANSKAVHRGVIYVWRFGQPFTKRKDKGEENINRCKLVINGAVFGTIAPREDSDIF